MKTEPSVSTDNHSTGIPLSGAGNAPLLWALAAVALFKLGILLINGPSFMSDSGVYIRFADAILDHGQAFAPVVWGADAVPQFIFRMAGYPLLIAAAKLLSPLYWPNLVVVFQLVLSGVALCLIFKVAARVFESVAAALLVIFLYAISSSVLWDNALLSDSLYGSLVNIVLFALLGQFVGCWRIPMIGAAGLAVLWGYSTWTRDNGIYFTFLPVILLFAGAGRSDGPAWRRLTRAGVFLFIVGGMVVSYMLLNLHRTGEAFFSITGMENWLRPAFDMIAYGYAQPFTGDDLVSRTVRETMSRYDFPAQEQFVRVLHQRCGCTPTQIQSMVFARYLDVVWHYPSAYVRVVVRTFNYFGLGSNLADPAATINQFTQLGTSAGLRVIRGFSIKNMTLLRQDFSVTTLIMMCLSGISAAICAILFTLFLLGIPFLGYRKWRQDSAISQAGMAAGFLWLTFASISLAFSMVHFEAHHATPIIPAGEFGIVFMLLRLRAYRKRKNQPELSS